MVMLWTTAGALNTKSEDSSSNAFQPTLPVSVRREIKNIPSTWCKPQERTTFAHFRGQSGLCVCVCVCVCACVRVCVRLCLRARVRAWVSVSVTYKSKTCSIMTVLLEERYVVTNMNHVGFVYAFYVNHMQMLFWY